MGQGDWWAIVMRLQIIGHSYVQIQTELQLKEEEGYLLKRKYLLKTTLMIDAYSFKFAEDSLIDSRVERLM